jgi:hypothetical protein
MSTTNLKRIPLLFFISLSFSIGSIVASTSSFAAKTTREPVRSMPYQASTVEVVHRGHRWRHHRRGLVVRPGWAWGAAWGPRPFYWSAWRPMAYRPGCFKRVKIDRYTGRIIYVMRRCRW